MKNYYMSDNVDFLVQEIYIMDNMFVQLYMSFDIYPAIEDTCKIFRYEEREVEMALQCPYCQDCNYISYPRKKSNDSDNIIMSKDQEIRWQISTLEGQYCVDCGMEYYMLYNPNPNWGYNGYGKKRSVWAYAKKEAVEKVMRNLAISTLDDYLPSKEIKERYKSLGCAIVTGDVHLKFMAIRALIDAYIAYIGDKVENKHLSSAIEEDKLLASDTKAFLKTVVRESQSSAHSKTHERPNLYVLEQSILFMKTYFRLEYEYPAEEKILMGKLEDKKKAMDRELELYKVNMREISDRKAK